MRVAIYAVDPLSAVLIETSLCGYPNAQINSIRFKWMMAAANPIKATPMPIAINQSKAWANLCNLRGEPQRGHTKARVLI